MIFVLLSLFYVSCSSLSEPQKRMMSTFVPPTCHEPETMPLSVLAERLWRFPKMGVKEREAWQNLTLLSHPNLMEEALLVLGLLRWVPEQGKKRLQDASRFLNVDLTRVLRENPFLQSKELGPILERALKHDTPLFRKGFLAPKEETQIVKPNKKHIEDPPQAIINPPLSPIPSIPEPPISEPIPEPPISEPIPEPAPISEPEAEVYLPSGATKPHESVAVLRRQAAQSYQKALSSQDSRIKMKWLEAAEKDLKEALNYHQDPEQKATVQRNLNMIQRQIETLKP